MIVSVTYTRPVPATAVAITMVDGTTWQTDAALPPDIEIRHMLADWQTEGGVISAYVAPVMSPPSLTARQLRLALIGAGVTLASIEAMIDAMPEPDRSVAEVEWEYATTYEREHPLVATLGAALGMSPAQIDALWATAATL